MLARPKHETPPYTTRRSIVSEGDASTGKRPRVWPPPPDSTRIPSSSTRTRRIGIDQVRGAAIISVIILHTVPGDLLLAVWAEFTIWQAVPIFLILMGYNGVRAARRDQVGSLATLSQAYSFGRLARRLRRLLVPFSMLWAFSLLLGLARGDAYVGPLLLVRSYPRPRTPILATCREKM